MVRLLGAGLVLALALPLAAPAAAQDMSAFANGPVFEEFGPHAPVDGMNALPADASFAVAFDVAEAASEGQRHRGFESAARFINMHAANGVDPANIKIAIVVHGKATLDLLNDAAWEKRERAGDGNPSAELLRALLDHGVRVILCGQSGTVNGVTKDELVEGVEVELSAMTAHALLQQDGYTVNPF
ncbi:MAG: DsrE family protein [Erythrobacter sp.]